MVKFSELGVGDRFKYEGERFVRIEEQTIEDDVINASSLFERYGWFFDDSDEVERYS